MDKCCVCGEDEGPDLRQCCMCISKFHHMCIIEEGKKRGWAEAEEGREVCIHCQASDIRVPEVVPPPARKRGRPKGSKNKAKAQDTKDASTPVKRGRPSNSQLRSGDDASEATAIFTPDHKSIRSETMYRCVSFKPLREAQIHKNDKKLLDFYADCQDFMLSGVVTEVRYVVGSENDPDFDTPGKKSKATTKTMVALYKITWNHTRFQREEPWITARLFYKGVEQFATLKANQRMNAGRSYLQISSFVPDEELHEMTEWNMKFLTDSSFDEENKDDEETKNDMQPVDDGSDDEWSEYVERGWKKHGNYDTTEDIEGLEDVEWICGGHYAGPTHLYEHEDNKDDTPVDELRISDEFKDLFKDPVKGFLAFMPLEFWKTVTLRTNAKALALQAAHPKGYVGGREFKKSFELVEVMKFIGLLIMMSVVQGGEYSLYWSKPSMSFLMPPTENFGRVMAIDRFKQLRACITFNDVVEPADPLWRIRPLINLLKASFKNFVVAGREISVDEACIPCRSSYARALIVYNPKKPLGKYHFRIYTAACATTWYVFAFKIHSKAAGNFDAEADDDADDDGEPAPDDDTAKPRDEVKPSALRQHVIDITKQWEGSHRVINLDNWYSSVQLCLTLLKMGLYCRGTVRSNRAHNPRFGMFDKKQIKSVMRGSSLVSVATSLGIIAVSWLDGTVVNMLSTADATTKSFVHRRIGSQTIQQECLSLVGLYNKYMQGVDRHDQLRERFSIASGASFKQWYKKLGFALIDIAITNLYVLYTICEPVNRRDSHLHFQTKLANQMLFETDWTL
ncbi:hypothetical protein Ae201684_019013 [Aphanomyces euteiches]|uniref:PiggyBac transposable element-derived protein domain-containing protein n=1 Tax=Aphanomyces euteiches TaxID=100861 RepID=A0A6G0W6A6_9STRA|nr:hypothetical protein Ae201684_019013 [Aphanomyces euteiches]